jgi:hypothetical protein
MKLALFAASCVVAAGCIVGEDAESPDEVGTLGATWGPYAPMPGHPTLAERDSFVAEVGPYAQEAERMYGTPAAAITAMTCNEGGFGWTKTAINANNIFGWKWYSADSAGGRPYWVLADQPASDPNNKYVVFSDRRDAVLFVAGKLANNARYKPHTDRYKADLANGIDVRAATNRWIEGIAYAGYNPYAHYPATTIKFMNNYRSPSTTYDAQLNLYKLSTPQVAAWVSLDAPAANSTVAGDVTLVSSVGGASSVKFYVRALGATEWYALGEDTTPPFSRLWATDPWVTNGAYEIKVEAWQAATLRATGIVKLSVAN